jgi:hypothetical protein
MLGHQGGPSRWTHDDDLRVRLEHLSASASDGADEDAAEVPPIHRLLAVLQVTVFSSVASTDR